MRLHRSVHGQVHILTQRVHDRANRTPCSNRPGWTRPRGRAPARQRTAVRGTRHPRTSDRRSRSPGGAWSMPVGGQATQQEMDGTFQRFADALVAGSGVRGRARRRLDATAVDPAVNVTLCAALTHDSPSGTRRPLPEDGPPPPIPDADGAGRGGRGPGSCRRSDRHPGVARGTTAWCPRVRGRVRDRGAGGTVGGHRVAVEPITSECDHRDRAARELQRFQRTVRGERTGRNRPRCAVHRAGRACKLSADSDDPDRDAVAPCDFCQRPGIPSTSSVERCCPARVWCGWRLVTAWFGG